MVELHIEPLVNFADLILAIGLIGLGLCGLAIIITVEIYYFRNPKVIAEKTKKGAQTHGKAVQQNSRIDRKYRPYARRVCFGPLPGIPRGCAQHNNIQPALELQEAMDAA